MGFDGAWMRTELGRGIAVTVAVDACRGVTVKVLDIDYPYLDVQYQIASVDITSIKW